MAVFADGASLIISALVGFRLVSRQAAKSTIAGIAMFYFPIAVFILLFYSRLLVWWIYGDSL